MGNEIRQIRQGDVLLVRIPEPKRREIATGADGLPLGGVRIEGERTGHAHALPGEVYELARGRRAVLLREATRITHQEHAHVLVPAGWWEVHVQREWVPSGGTRRRWD